MSKEKAAELLKDILKPLYFKVDKEWTIEEDNKVSNLINELEEISKDIKCIKWRNKNKPIYNLLSIIFP